jgi:hypothetical protein
MSSAIVDNPQKAREALSDTANVRQFKKRPGTKSHLSAY